MRKRKPGPRRKAEKTAEQPRDRLAEIRAEIRDVQQQIETKRRDGRVIRTAKDFESLERAIAALTNQLAALLVAEATQAALDDSENRRQARSFAQGVQSRQCHDFEPMSDDFRPRGGLSRPTRSADHLKVEVPFL